MVKHIAFTLYPVRDMERAKTFYEKGLGLKRTRNYNDKRFEHRLDNACFAEGNAFTLHAKYR